MVKLPKYVFWIAVLFCFPTILWADTYSFTDPNGKLTLTDKPCKLGPWFEKWKSATWLFRGESFDACWVVQPTVGGSLQIVIMDSSGVVSSHSPGLFRKDEGV